MQDYYSGFEGEPEIRFTLKSRDVPDSILRMWTGYFDSIMTRLAPEGGQWTGLARPYHLHEAWYDGAPWKVPDLAYVVEQWKGITTEALSAQCIEVHAAVLTLLNTALEYGGEVWISEE